MLADGISKTVFENIMYYKYAFDIKSLIDSYKLSINEGKQYFDQLITNELNNKTIFYDVGGCDGATTKDFFSYVDNKNRCIFFEPDVDNIRFAKEQLSEFGCVEYVNGIVGDKNEEQIFQPNEKKGSGRVAQSDVGMKLKSVMLDDYIDDNAYIKMDIEGYEINAIRGANRFSSERHPMMAVCVYHKADDLWRISQEILSMYDGYRVYLRHYTKFYTETVMYFVP